MGRSGPWNGNNFHIATLLEGRYYLPEGPGIGLHPLEQYAVGQLPTRGSPQFPQEPQALAVEGIICHKAGCHKEHPPGLVHYESDCPTSGGLGDDGVFVVLADGVEQGELAGLLAEPTPDRCGYGIVLFFRLGVLGFSCLTRIHKDASGPVRMVDNKGDGMPVLEVAGTGSEIRPPLGRGQHRIGQLPDTRLLSLAALAAFQNDHPGEEAVGEHPLGERLVVVIWYGSA